MYFLDSVYRDGNDIRALTVESQGSVDRVMYMVRRDKDLLSTRRTHISYSTKFNNLVYAVRGEDPEKCLFKVYNDISNTYKLISYNKLKSLLRGSFCGKGNDNSVFVVPKTVREMFKLCFGKTELGVVDLQLVYIMSLNVFDYKIEGTKVRFYTNIYREDEYLSEYTLSSYERTFKRLMLKYKMLELECGGK